MSSILTLFLGPAPTLVVEKFNEFKSIYSSITAAICALLEKDHLLKTKYRFCRSDVKLEDWELEGTPADTEIALKEIGQRLDTYVQCSRLDSRAAAIEELLMSPDVNDQGSDDETASIDDQEPDAMEQTTEDEKIDAADLDLGEEISPEDETPERMTTRRKSDKKKRKNRKPKKHKKKLDDLTEDEIKEKRSSHSRDVWRRVGSKFIGWYVCILCDKKQTSEEEYIKHLEWHAETHSPACMDCGNYFESMMQYEEHIGNLTKDLIYKCDEEGCTKAFQFKCRLECHKRTHIGELMYKCNDCGHKLSSIRSIIRHTRAKHLNEKPFQCHMCVKAFPIQSQLTRHIKDHISPPHYTCEHCGRAFSSRQGHHYHQLDHLGVKPHKCSICAKAFRNKTDMINHERIHSGDRPFTCELCGKSFVEKGALRKHGVVHTREKNFVCSNCGKQFGYKCSLDGHLKKCQHDIHNQTNLLAITQAPPPRQQRQHSQSQPEHLADITGETPSSGQNSLPIPTTSQDTSRNRNPFSACSIQGFIAEQHNNNSMNKNRNAIPQNSEDLLATATAVLKGQQEAARLMKKNPPYRPMSNLGHNSGKQSFDKHMHDAQMYSSYPMQLQHQRDTIDPDILASVLGQKLPLQAQMEAMQYSDRLQRDNTHSGRFHNLQQQDRDAQNLMDNRQGGSAGAGNYNNHNRHHQHPPSSIADSMMFQHQVRGHHYRP
ncbi:uncharacterized protein LOC120328391 [Styela clava]|uniref:zinc finger protein interacting with ribonucleoprotein K-like n=1 Tax=Styela clava TaxID=7725 RepID=UPI00193A2AFA|nr:zinc finger protein interacting with ribonucleoprotein K-like [Styela clava]